MMRQVVAAVAGSVLVAGTGAALHAQGRPAGDGRIWVELGVAAGQQAGRCVTCIPNATIGGASLSAAGGVTLRRGFGVAVLGRAFNQVSFESPFYKSRYVVALAQYAPPLVPLLSLNAGGGWVRHTGDIAADPSNGSGAALYAGSAVRLPARSSVAVTVVADVLQTIGGSLVSHPRLLSVGLSIGAATAPRHRP